MKQYFIYINNILLYQNKFKFLFLFSSKLSPAIWVISKKEIDIMVYKHGSTLTFIKRSQTMLEVRVYFLIFHVFMQILQKNEHWVLTAIVCWCVYKTTAAVPQHHSLTRSVIICRPDGTAQHHVSTRGLRPPTGHPQGPAVWGPGAAPNASLNSRSRLCVYWSRGPWWAAPPTRRGWSSGWGGGLYETGPCNWLSVSQNASGSTWIRWWNTLAGGRGGGGGAVSNTRSTFGLISN